MYVVYISIREGAMARDNKTTYLVLGMLAHKPMTGYDIKKKMSEYIKYFWKTGYGQLYPTLAALKKNGLVKMELDKTNNNRKPKTYSITAKGRAALRGWLGKPLQYETVNYEHLLKLFFSENAPIEFAIKNITAYIEENKRLLKIAKYFREILLPQLDEKDHAYYLLTSNFGLHVFTAQYEWAMETLKELNKMKKRVRARDALQKHQRQKRAE